MIPSEIGMEIAMSLITIDQLDMAVPKGRYEDLVRYIDFLNEGMEKFEINTPNRIAAFVAQVAHESADFRSTEENLNYSWQALRATWPPRNSRTTHSRSNITASPRESPTLSTLAVTATATKLAATAGSIAGAV